MSVPKGRRKESKFEAIHFFFGLRKEITDLMMRDFGFSEKKYLETIDHYRKSHEKGCKDQETLDSVVERYETRLDAFQSWYIEEERKAILDILRNIEIEFTSGNSIYPSETPARIAEFCERRKHINNAIGWCYCLKQEINYVICTLPVDINQYERFAQMVDHQIALYKGVRKADKRFLKQKDKEEIKDTSDNLSKEQQKKNSVQRDSLKGTLYQDIPKYSDVMSGKIQEPIDSRMQSTQKVPQRVPNTAKMNTSSFQQNNQVPIGVIRPPLPGQLSPEELSRLNRK